MHLSTGMVMTARRDKTEITLMINMHHLKEDVQ